MLPDKHKSAKRKSQKNKLLLKFRNRLCKGKVMEESLHDGLIFDICEELIQEDLFRLGIKGFELTYAQVKRAKDDAKSTLEASFNVFVEWKKKATYEQDEGYSAELIYCKAGLKAALKKANLNYLATKYFPTEN